MIKSLPEQQLSLSQGTGVSVWNLDGIYKVAVKSHMRIQTAELEALTMSNTHKSSIKWNLASSDKMKSGKY